MKHPTRLDVALEAERVAQQAWDECYPQARSDLAVALHVARREVRRLRTENLTLWSAVDLE